ncbi:MAG: ImmA/IrrE family metallo-endopeptidase [Mycobacteriaceae bacterium]|nr:ImmA/IrrE family metallo-endopeptidase [Mycobacteriaceae bacterium]
MSDDIPGRVRGLVRASTLSQREFANSIGLDDSKLSKSLSGARRFSSLDLARIAELCEVSVDWLVTGDEPPLAIAARTTGGSAGKAVGAARRYVGIRADVSGLGYHQPWRPVAIQAGGGNWLEEGSRLAAAAVNRVVDTGRSVTEPDLAALVEDVFGADVAIVDLGTGFDGVAVSSAEAKLIILAATHVPGRQRFTLAHELGHLLSGDNHDVHLDNDIFDMRQAKDPSEIRANAFASAFLMPDQELQVATGRGLDLAAFVELACRLYVTPSSLAYRLLKLRLIDAGACDRYKVISGAKAAGMTGRSPEFAQRVTQSGAARAPGLLVRDTYAAYESGAATLRPYANLLEVDVDELRRALELERGA